MDLSAQCVQTCDAPRPALTHSFAHQPLVDQRCDMVVCTPVRYPREFRDFVDRSALVVHDRIHAAHLLESARKILICQV